VGARRSIAGFGFHRHFGDFFLDYKSRRLARSGLFEAGSKCLLTGIVRFRINQGWRQSLLNAGLKITLRIGFESWSHEEQIGRRTRVSGEKQQDMNRSCREKSWSLKRICESTSPALLLRLAPC